MVSRFKSSQSCSVSLSKKRRAGVEKEEGKYGGLKEKEEDEETEAVEGNRKN